MARLKGTSQIIGFGGYAFAGKDASADILVDLGWKKTYMSKPLRNALWTLNPYIMITDTVVVENRPVLFSGYVMAYRNIEALIGYEKAKTIPEVRRLLQVLGTEVGRQMFGENVWSDLMKKEVSGYLKDGYSVAVTGIRFSNELQAIWEMGGVNIWVDRPGHGPVNQHASDNTLDRNAFDDVLHNDGDLDYLRHRVTLMLEAVEEGFYANN